MNREFDENCYCCGKKLKESTYVSGEVFQYTNATGNSYVVFENQEKPEWVNDRLSMGCFYFGKTCAKKAIHNQGYFNYKQY